MSNSPRKISNFHLSKLVYEGVKSEIYEARYTQAGGVVQNAAVKLLRPKMAWMGDELRAFLRELGWARDLRTSITPRIIEAGEREGNYFLAMEHVPGWTLAELLRSLAVLQVALPIQVGLTIAHRVAEGVQDMHEFSEGGTELGVVHLGIQPDNIIVSKSGAAMLVDFGTTTTSSSGEIIELDDRGGTYQAPERLRMLPIDRRADIYSLGRVLHDLAQSMSPGDLGADLPALIARACHVHVEERFPSMADLVVALELVAQNRGVSIDTSACASFAAEIFGKSDARRDPRAGRPQSVAPMVMQSEGLETAFAPTLEEADELKETNEKQKFHARPTVAGGASEAKYAEDNEITRGPAEGMETVMGGPMEDSESMATMPRGSSNPEESATDQRFGEPQFGNEEPTERSRTPVHADGESEAQAQGRSKRFVDQHKAVTVMGSPDMLRDLAHSEETTAVLEAANRAAQGFPEELIPTKTYQTVADEDAAENETVLGGDPKS